MRMGLNSVYVFLFFWFSNQAFSPAFGKGVFFMVDVVYCGVFGNLCNITYLFFFEWEKGWTGGYI